MLKARGDLQGIGRAKSVRGSKLGGTTRTRPIQVDDGEMRIRSEQELPVRSNLGEVDKRGKVLG